METFIAVIALSVYFLGTPILIHISETRAARRRWAHKFAMQDLEWERRREEHRRDMSLKYPDLYN